MDDKYAELRAAIDAGPTPGPWVAKDVSGAGLEIHMQGPEPYQHKQWPAFSTANADIKKDLVAYEAWVQFPTEKMRKAQTRTAFYIAAAHPETIRALLIERDQYARILDGLPQDAIDGGWTAAGISAHAKALEAENERLRDALECIAQPYATPSLGDPAVLREFARAALTQQERA